VGIGSRFAVTEILWDIYDDGSDDLDNDDLAVPLFLMLGDLSALRPGTSYPYVHSALDEYVGNQSFSGVQAEVLVALFPENQDLHYPATGPAIWPTPVEDAARADGTVAPPYDQTFADAIDNASPGVNPEIGLTAQRYFAVRVANQATLTATVENSSASLRVEILDFRNNLVAAGTGSATTSTPGGNFIVRVLPAAGPVAATFDLRIQLQ